MTPRRNRSPTTANKVYLGYGGRIPWWRWGLVLLAIPWYFLRKIWRDLFRAPARLDGSDPSVGPLPPGSGVFERILSLEQGLANEVLRGDPQALEDLFHPEFLEVNSSGSLVERDEAITWVLGRTEPDSIAFHEPFVAALGAGQFLVRYRSVSRSGKAAWRMSLWTEDDHGSMRIRYHQGTPTQSAV